MLEVSFKDTKLENIEGYRISCRLTTGKGFVGHFYVYIEERRQPETPFDSGIVAAETQDNQIKPVRGKLKITDDDRTYEFDNIDLSYMELGATRRQRTRYLEFRYDPSVTDARGASPITIGGNKREGLKPAGLGADYMGGCDENRHLLGFRAFVSAKSGTVARFSNLGCLPKSFLAKAVELNKNMQSSNKLLPDFTVKFSQGDFNVTKDNLSAFLVEESYGSLLNDETAALHRFLEEDWEDVERLRPAEYSANTLLRHDLNRDFRAEGISTGSVEIATLVFNQGYYHTLSVK